MSMSSTPRYSLLIVSGKSPYSCWDDSVWRDSVSSSSSSSSDSSLLIVSYCLFGFSSGIFDVAVLVASVSGPSAVCFPVFGRLCVSFGRLFGCVALSWVWISVVLHYFVAGLLVSVLHGVMHLCRFLDLLWTLWMFIAMSSVSVTVSVAMFFPPCMCIPLSSIFPTMSLGTIFVRVMFACSWFFMCIGCLRLVAGWSVILMALCWWCLATVLGG